LRRGKPRSSAYGGEDRGGPFWSLGMTAESSNAPFLRCGGACAWHRGRWGGRRLKSTQMHDIVIRLFVNRYAFGLLV